MYSIWRVGFILSGFESRSLIIRCNLNLLQLLFFPDVNGESRWNGGNIIDFRRERGNVAHLTSDCLSRIGLSGGCANHAIEGKRFSPPSTAVTQRRFPTCSVANHILRPCTLNACLCTPCAVGAAVSASLCSEHVNQTSYWHSVWQ